MTHRQKNNLLHWESSEINLNQGPRELRVYHVSPTTAAVLNTRNVIPHFPLKRITATKTCIRFAIVFFNVISVCCCSLLFQINCILQIYRLHGKNVNLFVYKCTLKHAETVHMKTTQGILKKILIGLLKLHWDIILISGHISAISKFCGSQVSAITSKTCISQLTENILTKSRQPT